MIDKSEYKYIFLDRDGVINVERPDDYVKSVSEFVFEDKAAEAIAGLSRQFGKIFIITNQRGVGRGIMSVAELGLLHKHMVSAIEDAGGRIDKIYFCTDICSTSINRKPNIGMAFQAQRDYPIIDFSKAIIIGNSKSDIEFGNKLGMYTILVGDKYDKEHKIYNSINAYYENLHKFTDSL